MDPTNRSHPISIYHLPISSVYLPIIFAVCTHRAQKRHWFSSWLFIYLSIFYLSHLSIHLSFFHVHIRIYLFPALCHICISLCHLCISLCLSMCPSISRTQTSHWQHTYTHTHTHACTHTRAHTRARVRAHTHISHTCVWPPTPPALSLKHTQGSEKPLAAVYQENRLDNRWLDLRCVEVCCSVLQCMAVCCSVLQGVAVCCSSVLQQCVAVCGSSWRGSFRTPLVGSPVHISVLQCVVVCCSVLQCVVVCCSLSWEPSR